MPAKGWERASLWAQSLPILTSGAMRPPPGRREVVVVGGGLTGLVTATVLEGAGMDVVVLERHGIGGVTTRGSTGKVTALQGARASTIASERDPAAAADYAAASTFGVAALRGLIEAMGIDCALTTAADHTFATEPDAAERCATELAAASAAGLPVEWVTDTDLPVDLVGAVRLPAQAHLDPGALCAGLAAGLGDRVVEHCAVTGIDEQDGGVTVSYEGGELVADHVVIATLGPIHDPALLSTRCQAMRSYAVAAPHPSPPADMYISLDERPRSVRPAWIDGEPAVVIGGEGHVVGETEGRPAAQRWDELSRYAAALGAGDTAYRWVAHDLIPSDGVPFIGHVAPGTQRTWVASGFQKWGISTAMVAADLILGELEGSARSWAPTFDPRRLADSATIALAKDAVRSVRHLVGDRVSELLHPGDETAPRCTHLGCVLAFDDGEQTWDCPCHGSRYDRDGQVICGPAVSPLDLDSITRR
jgi:glycine/D-amino acid oxidase-like deaminating enzyme